MKKILSVLFISFILIGCGGETVKLNDERQEIMDSIITTTGAKNYNYEIKNESEDTVTLVIRNCVNEITFDDNDNITILHTKDGDGCFQVNARIAENEYLLGDDYELYEQIEVDIRNEKYYDMVAEDEYVVYFNKSYGKNDKYNFKITSTGFVLTITNKVVELNKRRKEIIDSLILTTRANELDYKIKNKSEDIVVLTINNCVNEITFNNKDEITRVHTKDGYVEGCFELNGALMADKHLMRDKPTVMLQFAIDIDNKDNYIDVEEDGHIVYFDKSYENGKYNFKVTTTATIITIKR